MSKVKRYIDAEAFLENLTGYAPPEMVWDRGDIEHKLDEMATVEVVSRAEYEELRRYVNEKLSGTMLLIQAYDTDVINRHKILAEIKALPHVSGCAAYDCDEVEYAILHCDPMAVEEIKRGWWVYNPHGNDWGLGAWQCSLCSCKNDNLGMSKDINPYLFAGSKYCPHCGAKMDGKKKAVSMNEEQGQKESGKSWMDALLVGKQIQQTAFFKKSKATGKERERR